MKEKPEEFDEQRKSLLRETPSLDNIYEFIKALYDCAQFRYIPKKFLFKIKMSN